MKLDGEWISRMAAAQVAEEDGREPLMDAHIRTAKLVVHPDCAGHWRIESIVQADDGWFEVRARPVSVPAFRCALEREDIGVAMLLRESDDPDAQYSNPQCIFYLEPELMPKGTP